MKVWGSSVIGKQLEEDDSLMDGSQLNARGKLLLDSGAEGPI